MPIVKADKAAPKKKINAPSPATLERRRMLAGRNQEIMLFGAPKTMQREKLPLTEAGFVQSFKMGQISALRKSIEILEAAKDKESAIEDQRKMLTTIEQPDNI